MEKILQRMEMKHNLVLEWGEGIKNESSKIMCKAILTPHR